MLIAKILEITNECEDGNVYSFKAFEFGTGALLIPGEVTSDWFFDSKADYTPNGTDTNLEIIDTEETCEFSESTIKQSIADSQSEFDYKVGPAVLALVEDEPVSGWAALCQGNY